MKELFVKSKDFLENFTLDFDELATKLHEIVKIIFSINKIDQDINITFDESKLFGKSGSVSDTNISFNKTRIQILETLKTDDLSKNHLKNLEIFYRNYTSKKLTEHTEYEDILYDFIKKYKEIGAEQYFDMIGSYKTIKYEILDTIYHESEHILQNNYKKFLYNKIFPSDKKSKVLIFTVFFNTIYEKLKKEKIKFDYVRENYIFPIEFDARYISFKNMYKLYKLYFQKNVLFEKYLTKSIIIPKDFNINFNVNKIFDDYEKLYNLYLDNFGKNFILVNDYIQLYKEDIKIEFIKRYKEMMKIVEFKFSR